MSQDLEATLDLARDDDGGLTLRSRLLTVAADGHGPEVPVRPGTEVPVPPGTRLHLREGLHARVDCTDSDSDADAAAANPGTVVLRLPTKSVTFPAVCASALRAVLEGAPVSAGSLPGLDADDGLVVLRRLLKEGVVVAL